MYLLIRDCSAETLVSRASKMGAQTCIPAITALLPESIVQGDVMLGKVFNTVCERKGT